MILPLACPSDTKDRSPRRLGGGWFYLPTNMQYEILSNGNLRLIVGNPGELDVGTIEELLEGVTSYTDLCWIDPSICGDLTSAPMLAQLEYPEVAAESLPGNGYVDCGFWDNTHWAYRVHRRWGWMDYQIKDLVDELREKGEAILIAP